MEDNFVILPFYFPGLKSATISPAIYGYIIEDTEIVIITKTIATPYYNDGCCDSGYKLSLFGLQKINLKTKEIDRELSTSFNDDFKIISEEVYTKVKKLMKFLDLVKDNSSGFDSTINSIIAALTTS